MDLKRVAQVRYEKTRANRTEMTKQPRERNWAIVRDAHEIECRSVFRKQQSPARRLPEDGVIAAGLESEEHTSELQSPCNLVCRLLLEKKNDNANLSGPRRCSPHNAAT